VPATNRQLFLKTATKLIIGDPKLFHVENVYRTFRLTPQIEKFDALANRCVKCFSFRSCSCVSKPKNPTDCFLSRFFVEIAYFRDGVVANAFAKERDKAVHEFQKANTRTLYTEEIMGVKIHHLTGINVVLQTFAPTKVEKELAFTDGKKWFLSDSVAYVEMDGKKQLALGPAISFRQEEEFLCKTKKDRRK